MADQPLQGSERRLAVGQVWISKSGKMIWRVDKVGPGNYVTVTNLRNGYTLGSFTADEFLENMRAEPEEAER